jgi:hypothetical protein
MTLLRCIKTGSRRSCQTTRVRYCDNRRGLRLTQSVDGLRIDTVLNVNPSFFPPFADAAGTYLIGEVFNGDPVSACRLQKDMDGILNFP